MRILLVEDESRVAADIVATLGAMGYVVEVTGDGEDAWFRGDTEDYDLVVIDLGLPRMDGLAVLKRWRAAGRDMPVLVLTARGHGPNASRASMPGPMTISPSPSAWKSCSPACAP